MTSSRAPNRALAAANPSRASWPAAVAHLFGGALAQFAHSGDPAAQHALHWPNFGTDRVYLTVSPSVNAAALLPGTYPC